MGIEESKVSHHVHRGCKFHFHDKLPNRNNSNSWSMIYQCTLDQWKKGSGENYGFLDRILSCPNQVHSDCTPAFCINKQDIVKLRKSSPVFYFRKRVKVTKMAEHFEYNHIPAQLSSIQNFHFKSVLCFRHGLVVLHLARNRVSQLGLVDLHINKFLGVFGKQRVELAVDQIVGEISPDETRCLIQLPAARNRRVFLFQLYDLRSKDLLTEITLPSTPCVFAFDPRFTNSRLAVSNFDTQYVNNLSLVNVNTWNRLASNTTALPDCHGNSSLNLLRLQYSRAGHLLFAVCHEETSCRCSSSVSRNSVLSNLAGGNQNIPVVGGLQVGSAAGERGTGDRGTGSVACFLIVFDADSLVRLRVINFSRWICPQHACPVNLSPVMSRCGSRVAAVVNVPELSSHYNLVLVYQLPPPMSLMALARQIILQVYTEEEIQQLGLPHRILNFLRFQPSFSCAGSCISRSSSTATTRALDLL